MQVLIFLVVFNKVFLDLSGHAYVLNSNNIETESQIQNLDISENTDSSNTIGIEDDFPRIPEYSLFSPDFKVYQVDANESGDAIFTEDSITSEEMLEIELKSSSASILEENAEKDVTRFKRDLSESMYRNRIDVVDDNRPIAMSRGISTSTASAVLEVGIVTGYEFSLQFQFNKQNILTYLSIMLNSVNARFAVLADPTVTLKFAGLYVINKDAAQPFIKNSKNGTAGYTLETMMRLFGEWVAENMKTLPVHDVMPLISKVKSDSDIVGIAFLKGACWLPTNTTNMSRTVQVTLDDAQTYSGTFTLAHELAHSLGAPHDGFGDAKDCNFSDGYIMSYDGWGSKNKFNFSMCSRRQMKLFIESSGGACLHTTEVKNYLINSKKQIGEVMSPSQECKFETGVKTAFAMDDDTANEYCKRIICKVPIPGKFTFRILSHGKPPGFKSPCGKGGRCEHGECVNNKETAAERFDLNTVCKRRSFEPSARRIINDEADDECKILKCSIKSKAGKFFTATYGTPLNGSFPCGKGGKCIDQRCIGNKEDPRDKLDLVKVCAKKTENPAARLYGGTLPSEYCKLLKCVLDRKGSLSVSTYPEYVFPNDSFPCGSGGKCVNKQCVGESVDRFNMTKECKTRTGNPKAEIFVQTKPNDQCTKLFCMLPTKGKHVIARTYDIPIADGSFPCGPKKGVCKAKICV